MLDVETVEKAIGLPASEWQGRCHEIAGKIIDSKLVRGKLRYGHWKGPVHEMSMFRMYYCIGIVKHGWIELPDGNILDATRWVFEFNPPYIYVGKNDYYDAGGNEYRLANMQPPPKYSTTEKSIHIPIKNAIAIAFVTDNLEFRSTDSSIIISLKQAFWLANLPLQKLGDAAKPIYKSLIEAEMGAFIPYDNRHMVLDD